MNHAAIFNGDNTFNRRRFLAGLAAMGISTIFAQRGVAATEHRPPNVVLFIVDDLGWMDCGVYGSHYYETPNVDRLATLGVRFTQAYAAAPLCTATRASLMTGKYPARLHVTGASGHLPVSEGPLMPESAAPWQKMLLPRCQGYLPLEEYTYAEALRDAGYRTGFVGKWHLGHDPECWPEHQGFDENIGGGRWPGPPSYFSPYHIDTLPDGPDGEYIADRLTDEAVRFIENAKDGPFLLNFWQYAVHAPYQGKEAYRLHFEQKQDPRAAQDNAVMGAMIKSMDESLGRVLDTLEKHALMDNTIIIFSSDNGGNMYDRTARDGTNLGAWAPEGRTPTNNAPLRGGKGSVYEGGIRVPAIIYWPGNTRGGEVSNEILCSADVYPTLLDMLDISPDKDQIFDGMSIVPALFGKRLRRKAVYGHFPHHTAAVPCRPASWVRAGDWKLIRFYEQDDYFPNRIELYNLREDIGELHNRAAELPDRVRELEAMLDRHLAETGALVPKPNPDYQPGAVREVDSWTASEHCWLKEGTPGLLINSTGKDPYIFTHAVPEVSGKLTLHFDMQSQSSGLGQFFWATRTSRDFGPQQRIDFTPHHDNNSHKYEISFETNTPLTAVRLDPAGGPGRIILSWLGLAKDGVLVQDWLFYDYPIDIPFPMYGMP